MSIEPLDSGTYRQRVSECLASLGVPSEVIFRRGLPFQFEAADLEVIATTPSGREHQATPATAKAWRALQAAAQSDGIELSVVSAFRSLERQADIVRGKLAAGLPWESIFCASAPPGYSEHHTGRAIDMTTPGFEPLQPVFEESDGFDWLVAHASEYGFHLSYPKNNALGFIYEPWHWCFTAEGSKHA